MSGPLAAHPRRRLAVLTCMDARIDVLPLLGLQRGDAHVLRNAGGLPTEDMLRSLAISQRKLGTTQVRIVQHTGCGMQDFDDVAFRDECRTEDGVAPSWDVAGFADVHDSVRASVNAVRRCRFVPHRDAVSGYVYDVVAQTLTQVDE